MTIDYEKLYNDLADKVVLLEDMEEKIIAQDQEIAALNIKIADNTEVKGILREKNVLQAKAIECAREALQEVKDECKGLLHPRDKVLLALDEIKRLDELGGKMPCFKCSKCGCVENTASSNFWNEYGKPNHKPLCSECDPEIGKWHGMFKKEKAKGKVGKDGFLK